MFKKITAGLTALCLSAAMTVSAAGSEVSHDDYLRDYNAYKVFYQETYVPSYHIYNQKLKEFAASVKTMDLATMDDYNRVMDFINRLKAERKAFFGDRVTEGTSRYEVPRLRDAMYAAEEAAAYGQAAGLCAELVAAVDLRMDFLRYLGEQLDGFQVNPPQPDAADADVVFTYEKWSDGSFGFKISITNTSSASIDGWVLAFDHTGFNISSVWTNGGSILLTQEGDRANLTPRNQYQNGYTIPAGGTVVIEGSASGNAADGAVSNAIFNGKNVRVRYGAQQN